MLKKLRRRLAVIFTAFTGAVLAAALVATFSRSVKTTLENSDTLFLNRVDQVASAFASAVASAAAPQQNGFYVVGIENVIVCAKAEGQTLLEVTQTPEGGAADGVTPQTREALFAAAKTAAMEQGAGEGQAGAIVNPGNTFTYFSVVGSVEAVETGGAAGSGGYKSDVSISVAGALPMPETVSLAFLAGFGATGLFDVRYAGVDYRATYFTLTETAAGGSGSAYEVAVLEETGGQRRQIMLDGLWMLLILLAGLALLFLASWWLAGLVLRSTEEGLRRQTEFVAAAGHELRSPLAVIRASLSAARDAERDDDAPGAEKFNAAALDEADRMGRLVNDLLLLAGGDAGSWQLHKSPVDLDTLLIDTAESYTPLARAKGVRLELSLPDETLPQPPGDAERLRQILAVLLDNALQYAPGGTAITLAAAAQKGRVGISVADHGSGIPGEEKPRVFERFYRADKSRHDKAHFGLGLSIARDLAVLHGGKLTVADTEGGGATFTLTLPVS